MDVGTASVIVGLGVALITGIASPFIISEIKRREERDPTKGWQAAYTVMQRRIDQLDNEVQSLRDEVQKLEEENSSKNVTIAKQEAVIADKMVIISDQSRALVAKDQRISQLEAAWPSGVTLPPPDPAIARLLAGR